jgi:uncharacterized protein YcbK (DUF882 family)
VNALSRSFSAIEFECHSGQSVPAELMTNLEWLANAVLQPIRDEWGAPLIVVSGWRSLTWNLRVGGALKSTHLTAEGADIRPVHLRDVGKLRDLALSKFARGELSGLGGLGDYPRWLHVDTRRPLDGHLRRWTGTGVGSEPG